MTALSKSKPKNTFSDEAMIKIQNAILDGELRPNQRIIESQLSRQLDMSRTPIREAIIKLQMMGLLISIPDSGLVVAENTPKRRKDIIEIREMFESYAIKDFCEHATDQQIKKAEKYNRLCGEATYNNVEDYRRNFRLYHDTILEGCSNTVLVMLIKFRRDWYFIRKIASLLTTNELLRAVQKREAILEACKERNSSKAQRLIKDYIWWEAKAFEQKMIEMVYEK